MSAKAQNNQTIMSCDQYYSQHNEYYKWSNKGYQKVDYNGKMKEEKK